MSKFKVGDQVTIKPKTPGIGVRQYGSPYVVTAVYTSSVLITGDDESAFGAQFMDAELSLYNPHHVVFKPEAEADALAMIEAVKKWRHDWFNEPVEGVHRKRHLRRLDTILDGAKPVE